MTYHFKNIMNLKRNGIVLTENDITLLVYNTGDYSRKLSLYNQSLIYKVVSKIDEDIASKIIVKLNHGIFDEFDEDKISEYKNLIVCNQNEVVYEYIHS